MKPELHPACAAFPPMPEDDLRALADDIKANGLIEAITMLDGQILDGRCRWEACEIAGVEPRTVAYEGDNPVGFILSKNKHRRHLSKSQMSMIVADLVNLQPGSNQFQAKKEVILKKHNLSATQLSEQADIPLAYTNYARTVRSKAEPHIDRMVRDGRVHVRTAAEAVRTSSRATQADWTAADVERVGRKVIRAYPSNQHSRQKSTGKKASPERRVTIDIPYKIFTFPTAEETGFPTEGTSTEKDAFFARYGRTPVHAKTIRHLVESQGRTEALVQAIVAASNDSHPDADQFLADIAHMLSWVPQTDKTPDYRIDFAARARRQLATLRDRLPRAIDRLNALNEALRVYNDQRESA